MSLLLKSHKLWKDICVQRYSPKDYHNISKTCFVLLPILDINYYSSKNIFFSENKNYLIKESTIKIHLFSITLTLADNRIFLHSFSTC